MHAHAVETPCPRCRQAVDLRILGLSSGLGPAWVRCRCGAAAPTWRKEWPQFRFGDRARYVGMSIASIATLALLGGIAGDMSFPVRDVPWGSRVIGSSPGFLIGALQFALLGIAVQIHRVIASIARGGTSPDRPFLQTWLELQTLVQLKACAFAIAVAAVGGGISWWLSG